MKAIGLLFAILVGSLTYVEVLGRTGELLRPERDYEDNEENEDNGEMSKTVAYVLGRVREGMKTGILQFHMPILDPLFIPKFEENLNVAGKPFEIRLIDFSIADLSTIEMKDVGVDMKNRFFHFHFFLPTIEISGFSYVKGDLLNMPLLLNGDMLLKVFDLNVDGKGQFDLSLGDDVSSHLNYIKLNASLGNLSIDMTNQVGKKKKWSRFYKKMVTNAIKNTLKKFAKEIMEAVDGVVLKIVNGILDRGGLVQILKTAIP